MTNFRVHVEPSGVTLSIAPGETVLEAARRCNVAWRSVCGGFAQCRTCWFQIVGDDDAWSAIAPLEAAALALLAPTIEADGSVRLACQARPLRDATVHKIGVRAGHASS
ncbi:MAG: 2Fe-2S iron-sulfur cluster binding domain-containing protein [Alphaproteobacteria bacterium]|nr:2Fe-2S iron-sulfur cluster binding domain-containing protein [Alphaproteobacteria bacterium]